MVALRIIPSVFLCLFYVLLSNLVSPDASSSFVCPLIELPKQYANGTTVNEVLRSAACQNGRNMSGCCVTRVTCDYNTSNIDLSMYGPRGLVMPCSPDLSCCPQKYILHIPISTNRDEDNSGDSSDSGDNSGDANNNQVDSDSASDEADENSDKIPTFSRK